MTTQTKARRLTAEDLWDLGAEGEHCELDEGRLVELTPAGPRHGWAVAEITGLLEPFVREHGLGLVFGAETGFRLTENCVRAPDLAFVRTERIPSEGLPEKGYFPGPPDLAVEVLSPEDFEHPGAVQRKIGQYLEAGTRLVWILDLRAPKFVVYRIDGSVDVLGPDGALSGEDVVPGFLCPVQRLLAAAPGKPQGSAGQPPAPPSGRRRRKA